LVSVLIQCYDKTIINKKTHLNNSYLCDILLNQTMRLSEAIGRSNKLRLMNIPLGVPAKANPCSSYSYT